MDGSNSSVVFLHQDVPQKRIGDLRPSGAPLCDAGARGCDGHEDGMASTRSASSSGERSHSVRIDAVEMPLTSSSESVQHLHTVGGGSPVISEVLRGGPRKKMCGASVTSQAPNQNAIRECAPASRAELEGKLHQLSRENELLRAKVQDLQLALCKAEGEARASERQRLDLAQTLARARDELLEADAVLAERLRIEKRRHEEEIVPLRGAEAELRSARNEIEELKGQCQDLKHARSEVEILRELCARMHETHALHVAAEKKRFEELAAERRAAQSRTEQACNTPRLPAPTSPVAAAGGSVEVAGTPRLPVPTSPLAAAGGSPTPANRFRGQSPGEMNRSPSPPPLQPRQSSPHHQHQQATSRTPREEAAPRVGCGSQTNSVSTAASKGLGAGNSGNATPRGSGRQAACTTPRRPGRAAGDSDLTPRRARGPPGAAGDPHARRAKSKDAGTATRGEVAPPESVQRNARPRPTSPTARAKACANTVSAGSAAAADVAAGGCSTGNVRAEDMRPKNRFPSRTSPQRQRPDA